MFVARSLVPHVSTAEGRGLERLLADTERPILGGAVIEATYVATDPPLLPRLRGLRVPYTVDPQTLRFSSPRYLSIAGLRRLPYAPDNPYASHPGSQVVDTMVREALLFQARHEVDLYLTPATPMLKPTLRAVKAHRRVHDVASASVGQDVPLRPLLAAVAPTLPVMRSPFAVYEALLDRAYAGIYAQPIRLNPKLDSVEWLVAYAQFLLTAADYNLPVVAARTGAFGLILTALGVDAFDSGFGERESFNLRALNRVPASELGPGERGGPRRRIYARDLLTSIDELRLRVLLDSRTIGPRLSCDLGSCRFGGFGEQLANPRSHFFHVRLAELAALRELPTTAMRVQHTHDRLRAAIELGRLVNSCLEDAGHKPVSFDHLDVWLAVLTRVAAKIATVANR